MRSKDLQEEIVLEGKVYINIYIRRLRAIDQMSFPSAKLNTSSTFLPLYS